MIERLIIRDFAIIDELEIEFRNGLTVLTGETGAGKSILVQALHLLLGGRSSQDMIRTDQDAAEVEADLRLGPDSPLKARLDELDLWDDESLGIRRIISRSGRNRAYINGRSVPVATLATLASGLVDISGQHEHIELADERNHRRILDDYGDLGSFCRKLKDAFDAYRSLQRQLAELLQRQNQRQERKDYLEFALSRIDQLDPKPDELETLQQDLVRIRGADRLEAGLRKIVETIYEREGSALDLMSLSLAELNSLTKIDSGLSGHHDQLHSVIGQIEELARDLQSEHEKIEIDPARLEHMEERAAALKGLVRAYGRDLREVIDKREQMKRELLELEHLSDTRHELEKRAESALEIALSAANDLSLRRKQAAQAFTHELSEQLRSLAMAGACLEVNVQRAGDDELDEHGLDKVRFLLSANPGEELRPLSRVASGGELSRVFLALKRVLLTVDRVPTHVFDEVDSGVGGEVAKIIGEKLSHLSARHQVICITHLSQIAAFADHHFVVVKKIAHGRTVTQIRELTENERVEELARMVGGQAAGEKARGYAQELLSHLKSKRIR